MSPNFPRLLRHFKSAGKRRPGTPLKVRHLSRSRTKVRPGLPSSLTVACHPRPLCPTIRGCRYTSTALSSVCAPPIQIATRQEAIVSLTVVATPLSPPRPFGLEAEVRLLAPSVKSLERPRVVSRTQFVGHCQLVRKHSIDSLDGMKAFALFFFFL